MATTPNRYSPYWKWVSKLAKVVTGGLCSYPSCMRAARQTHHAAYLAMDVWGDLRPIRGTEKPGIHVFPLCLRHHSKFSLDGAHHPRNWVRGVIEPDRLDACQKPKYYLLLVQGFKEKSDLFKSRTPCQSIARSKLRVPSPRKTNPVLT